MSAALEPKVTLPWLVRLRWLALGGQLLALLIGVSAPTVELEWRAFVGVSAVTLLTNLGLTVPKWTAGGNAERLTGSVLAFDTVLLTVLLAASGGSMNPFTVFYLVHITLSSVALSAAWTSLIAGLSVLGFGLLFLTPQDPHALHHAAGLQHHLNGMWVAFVLASGFTAFFVRRITEAIRAQREEIAALRETSAQNARLASLTTLAAGAAHELGTPLGTIAVAAHEAAAVAARVPGAGGVADDLRLIELETERCREILSRMSVRASEHPEPSVVLSRAELERRLRDHLGDERFDRVELRFGAGAAELFAPGEALAQSIAALIQNGIEASPEDGRVVVGLAREAAFVRISVEDAGSGIAPEVLAKVGEPFFTTKQPGRGLGLGVFLARAFIESQGGALAIESSHGRGTRAVLRVPATAGGAA
jgi:two-component system, sensor histidine kinase RegB